MEAYNRLKAVQRESESFSQVIKRAVRKPFDVRAFLEKIAKHTLSDEAATAVETQVRRHRRPSNRKR